MGILERLSNASGGVAKALEFPIRRNSQMELERTRQRFQERMIDKEFANSKKLNDLKLARDKAFAEYQDSLNDDNRADDAGIATTAASAAHDNRIKYLERQSELSMEQLKFRLSREMEIAKVKTGSGSLEAINKIMGKAHKEVRDMYRDDESGDADRMSSMVSAVFRDAASEIATLGLGENGNSVAKSILSRSLLESLPTTTEGGIGLVPNGPGYTQEQYSKHRQWFDDFFGASPSSSSASPRSKIPASEFTIDELLQDKHKPVRVPRAEASGDPFRAPPPGKNLIDDWDSSQSAATNLRSHFGIAEPAQGPKRAFWDTRTEEPAPAVEPAKATPRFGIPQAYTPPRY